MIYQLPNGRIIEMSLEQYLDLDEQDFRELNGLGKEFTSDITNPFINQLFVLIKEKSLMNQKSGNLLKENQILMKSRT